MFVMKDGYLCLSRILGRGKELHLSILALRHCNAAVCFQVEVLLSSNMYLPCEEANWKAIILKVYKNKHTHVKNALKKIVKF